MWLRCLCPLDGDIYSILMIPVSPSEMASCYRLLLFYLFTALRHLNNSKIQHGVIWWCLTEVVHVTTSQDNENPRIALMGSSFPGVSRPGPGGPEPIRDLGPARWRSLSPGTLLSLVKAFLPGKTENRAGLRSWRAGSGHPRSTPIAKAPRGSLKALKLRTKHFI